MKHALKDIPRRQMQPGFQGQFIHTDTMTLAYFTIDPDSSSPAHAHVHQQVVNVLEGQLELTVAGTPHLLGPGDIFTIASNVEHSARSITAVRVLDVFTPVREDYR